MTDREAREFVEMLAAPESTDPPPCPVCEHSHPLETGCELPSRDEVVRMETVDDPADVLEAAGRRE